MTSVEDHTDQATTGDDEPVLYEHAHHLYRAAGWTGPLPLPPGAKGPPPDGYTGYHGEDPSGADTWAWANEPPNPGARDYRGTSQLALRMPAGVIGVDVDEYGDKHGAATMTHAVQTYGPLPPTWCSTARGPGPSGIYYYRVPAGTALPGVLGFPDRQLGHVEIIQRHHRYAVAWPSTNPHADGAPYLWYSPDGAVQDGPPNVDQLPELPRPWLDALARDLTPGAPAVDDATVAAFARQHTAGTNTGALDAIVRSYHVASARAGTARHDAMLNACCWAAREAALGRFPAVDAARALRDTYILSMSESRDGARLLTPADARMEWARSWAFAVAQTVAQTPEQTADRAARHHDVGAGQPGGRVLKRASPLATSGDVTAPVTPPDTPPDQHGSIREHPGASESNDRPDRYIGPPTDGGDDTTISLRDVVHPDDWDEMDRAEFELAVDGRIRHKDIQREADRRIADRDNPPRPALADVAVPFDQLDQVPAPAMLVRGLVPEQAVGFLNGRSGSYKSFVMVALACSIASGTPVMGDDTLTVARPEPVLYIAGEGSSGVALRLRAYAATHGLGSPPVTLVRRAVNLTNPAEVDELYTYALDHGYRHVYIDTWRASTPGLQENDNTEIGVVTARANRARDEHGISTLYADHTGHAGERAVGGGAKWDNADYALMIRMPGADRAADQQRTLTVQKLKDAETHGRWPLRLRQVEAVRDQDGWPAAAIEVGALDDDSGPLTAEPRWWDIDGPALPDELARCRDKGADAARDAWRVLRFVDDSDGITRAQVEAALLEGPRAHGKSSVTAGLALLVRLGFADKPYGHSRYVVDGAGRE